jgi:sigma-B regulation protein RsbU (phosphoserine phosphatase)
MFPAQLVSGDFFDYFPLPDGSFLFVVGDVSGKGVAAGVLTSGVTAALRAEALHELPLERILERLNRVLCDVTGALRFVTLICAKLQPSNRRLDFARAGHPPGLVYRPSTAECFSLDAGGPVLGVLPEASFDSSSLLLQAGDVVVLYTDGVSEAENGSDEPYPTDRLAALLSKAAPGSATEILESIRTSVVEYTDGRGLADDATLVVLKANPSRGERAVVEAS